MPQVTLTRRSLLAVSASALFLVAAGLHPAVAASPAATMVKGFADQLVAIVNRPGKAEEKKAALQPVIDQNVDVAQIARFCLGRFWASATPAQQQQYVTIFHRKLLNSISGHLGDYTGVSYTMTGETQKGDTTLVGTAIVRPNEPTVNVQWVVDGAGKVIDVVAEGTSLRLTERQDYASFLGQHGGSIDALLSALQKQLDAAG